MNEDIQAVIDALITIRDQCAIPFEQALQAYVLYQQDCRLRIDQQHNMLHMREAALMQERQARVAAASEELAKVAQHHDEP